MPLVDYACPEHGIYEVLTTVEYSDACPECGVTGGRLFSPPVGFGSVLTPGMTVEERGLALRHKRGLEENMRGGKYDSMTMRGPREFRPDYESKFK